MYLKSLEILGFKSFAKKSELVFTSRITSIVGPNGSGKSNIAEAFRFVLGEQSFKSLRGKKGEDMIWNGGVMTNKQNRASVKVVFDNKDKIFNIDFPEVTLERVVHRDGINEYFINGTEVRLRDSIELLSGAHIGASGHHIISQGEADKILNSNIKERREMLEDALGLKIYHYKRIESEKKLEKTQENAKSVESLRRELAPHLKFLKKQMEKVEKARQLKDELRVLYKDYFKREEIYIENQRAFLDNEKRGPREELAKLDHELKNARKTLSKSNEEIGRSKDLLNIEEKIKALRLAREGFSREQGRIEGEIHGLKKNIERFEFVLSKDENKTLYLRDVEGMYHNMGNLFTDAERVSDVSVLKMITRQIKEFLLDFISKHKSKVDTTEIYDAKEDILKLESEKTALEKRISHDQTTEGVLNSEYLAIKDEIEKEKEGGLLAEKDILKIMARQQKINSDLAVLKTIEEKLAIEEAEFKRELYEAGVLSGREVLDYKDCVLENSEGGVLSREAVVGEPRHNQYDRRKVIERIKIRLEEFGVGGEDVEKEYKETTERDIFLEKELNDLEKSADSLRTLIRELEEKLDAEFKKGVHKINEKFQEFFSLMFGGGSASLSIVREERRKRKSLLQELEDETNREAVSSEKENPEGIDIQVNLPKKRIRGLQMLSGGERALTSIALLFAMSQVNPPPFIILDETDAALDEANSRKYADMVEGLSKYSELILITHNRETMSRAGMIYGVTMTGDGVSKLLSIDFEQAVKVAK